MLPCESVQRLGSRAPPAQVTELHRQLQVDLVAPLQSASPASDGNFQPPGATKMASPRTMAAAIVAACAMGALCLLYFATKPASSCLQSCEQLVAPTLLSCHLGKGNGTIVIWYKDGTSQNAAKDKAGALQQSEECTGWNVTPEEHVSP